MIPNGYLDSQEKVNTSENGKIMGKYRRLHFPFNLFKAHGSLKAKIIILLCGSYIVHILIHMTNLHKEYGDACMAIYCCKFSTFNMKWCILNLTRL